MRKTEIRLDRRPEGEITVGVGESLSVRFVDERERLGRIAATNAKVLESGKENVVCYCITVNARNAISPVSRAVV